MIIISKCQDENRPWRRHNNGTDNACWLIVCLLAAELRVCAAQRVVVVSCVSFGRANKPNCDRHSHKRRRHRRRGRGSLECTMNQRQSDKFKMTSN